MTKELADLLVEVGNLPEEQQHEIADLLRIQLGYHVDIPQWQKDLLDERLAEIERNPDEVITLEELKEELARRRLS